MAQALLLWPLDVRRVRSRRLRHLQRRGLRRLTAPAGSDRETARTSPSPSRQPARERPAPRRDGGPRGSWPARSCTESAPAPAGSAPTPGRRRRRRSGELAPLPRQAAYLQVGASAARDDCRDIARSGGRQRSSSARARTKVAKGDVADRRTGSNHPRAASSRAPNSGMSNTRSRSAASACESKSNSSVARPASCSRSATSRLRGLTAAAACLAKITRDGQDIGKA